MNTQDFIFPSQQTHSSDTIYCWKTPSNIALVKYWGKLPGQIPKNASISFTLNNCHTTTSIQFEKSSSKKIEFDLFFEGKEKNEFKPKIQIYFERILEFCPYLLDYKLTINSENSFPHSSGIASSASSMAAIAMCLISFEKDALTNASEDYFNKKASFLARLGSGSASRSINGPLVIWGKHDQIKNSSDLFSILFPYEIPAIFQNYQDTILLIDKGEKEVSSTVGHNLMHNHPFASHRFEQANDNLSKIIEAIKNGAIKDFIKIVESEALSLHAMMLTSDPYFILIKPNTLSVINSIWEYRKQNNSNICFTLDAGANVHVLYPFSEKKTIEKFIENELAQYCQNGQYITDHVGLGAVQIVKN